MRNKHPCNVYLQGSALEMVVRRSSFLFGNSTDLLMPRFRFLLGDAQDMHHNPVTSAAARLLLLLSHQFTHRHSFSRLTRCSPMR
jgi:hypothetical protein